MKLLAFDTSTARGTVALLEDDRVLASRNWLRQGSHSEMLTSELEACVTNAGLSIRDIEALAIGHGPGSFTGIRVAVNAARTLGYSLSIPVFVHETGEILAEAITPQPRPLVTLVNAQKNAVFATWFEGLGNVWRKTRDTTMVEVEGLESLVTSAATCVGDGYDALFPILTPTLTMNLLRQPGLDDLPSAESLGRLTFRKLDEHPPLVWKDVQALYIRASGAEEKR